MTIKKIIFATLGFIFFALAILGSWVPVLPTVPFLLLSAFFFTRSSDRLNNWFINTKAYHKYLESYMAHKSMTLRTKIFICTLASVMMIFAFVMLKNMDNDILRISLRVFLVVAMLTMYWYFHTRIKTVSQEEMKKMQAEFLAAAEAKKQAEAQTNQSDDIKTEPVDTD
jgi:uncharacterized membrane protein YbaN (DUF454 family)